MKKSKTTISSLSSDMKKGFAKAYKDMRKGFSEVYEEMDRRFDKVDDEFLAVRREMHIIKEDLRGEIKILRNEIICVDQNLRAEIANMGEKYEDSTNTIVKRIEELEEFIADIVHQFANSMVNRNEFDVLEKRVTVLEQNFPTTQ